MRRAVFRIGIPVGAALMLQATAAFVAYRYALIAGEDPRLIGAIAVLGSGVLILVVTDLLPILVGRFVRRAALQIERASFRAVKAAAFGGSGLAFVALAFALRSPWALLAVVLALAATMEMGHRALADFRGEPEVP